MELVSLQAPVRTPFLDERGSISRPWEVFLQTVARLIQVNSTRTVARFEVFRLDDGAGITNIDVTAPVTDGECMALVLLQGVPTGGQQITWGSTFFPTTSVDIDLDPAALTKLTFYGYQGLWYDFSRS